MVDTTTTEVTDTITDTIDVVDTTTTEVTDTIDVVDTAVTDDAHELEESHDTHELEESHDTHELKAMHNMYELKAMHNMYELKATHDDHEVIDTIDAVDTATTDVTDTITDTIDVVDTSATHDAHEVIDTTNVIDTTTTVVTDTINVVDTTTIAEDMTVAVGITPVDNALVVQLIQVKNAELITKAQASINEYGIDYTGGDTDRLMKFEMWINATELSSFGAVATEIRGYQFDMDWNAAEFGALNFPTIAGDNIGFNAANPANAAITFNSTTGDVAMASSTAIVDTDVSNDGPPLFVGSEQLIGTFYMNPTIGIETMSLSINNMLIVTDTDNIQPSDYSTVLNVSSIDATIQTDATNCLDNVGLNYFKDGVDTGVFTLVEGGDITFPDTNLVFDAVKLSDPTIYTSGIAADDGVDVLRDIVHLDSLIVGSAAWHAADVNNDGVIAADDAVAILRHIVHLDTIDTFDLIDNITGNRITNLDANAIDVGQWSIVANGNVDQSGGFMDVYVVADIV